MSFHRSSATCLMLLMGLVIFPYAATAAFAVSSSSSPRCTDLILYASHDHQQQVATDTDNNNPLHLTPELLKLTNAFQAIGDDKLRYKQLLYMANQLPPMPDSLKTKQNQVPGCLSTVHVHASLDNGGRVIYQGDSDGLLTKGLVALLVRGLGHNTAEAIQAVDASFIQKAGIAASLTPGRNNGFLNMLAVMKQQAMAVSQQEAAQESIDGSASSSRPKNDAIVQALQALKPVHLELIDNSHQHAGHAGASPNGGGESHFDVTIVAQAFEGLNLVQRHKLVYMILGPIMPTIHALQIRAQTPQEAGMQDLER